jgi:Family of unknown function (DUF6057)
MPVLPAKIPVKAWNILFFVIAVLILVFFFRQVDLSLVYHMHQPFFSNRCNFLQYYLSYPGGISDYAGLFVFQFYGNKTAAILLVLLQLSIWVFLFYCLVRNFLNPAFLPIPVVLSAVPLIAGHGSYPFTPDISVAVTLALGSAVIYRKINPKTLASLLLYFLMALLVFYMADSIGLAVFLAGTLPFQIHEKKVILSLLSVTGILILPLIWYWFDMHYASLGEAYRGHFITGGKEFIPLLINSIPLLVFILLSASLYAIPLLNRKNFTSEMTLIKFMILLPFLFFVSFKLTYNPEFKKVLRIDRMACEKKWDELLKITDIDLVQNKTVLMQANRALYHKGNLLNYLFFYPQNYRQDGLIIQSPTSSSIAVPLSEIYYDMGLINEARHWANEALTVLGNQPRILRQLVKTYLITGQYRTAEKYLNIMESSLITRSWANAHRIYLFCDECVEKDPEMGHLRRMNPATDFFAAIENPYDNLRHLVADSIPNPMASEYFIAHRLLSCKPGEILSCLPKLKSIGYDKLPLSCQEAILMYQANRGKKTFSLPGYTIDASIQNNFNDFSAILFGKYKGDLAAAKKSLNKFSQTYWYYYLYSRPLKSSIKNQGSYSEKY